LFMRSMTLAIWLNVLCSGPICLLHAGCFENAVARDDAKPAGHIGAGMHSEMSDDKAACCNVGPP
jgi:hypothetical protein